MLVFIFIVFFAPLIPDLFKGNISKATLSIMAFLSFLFVFILYLFFRTYYTLKDSTLHIKFGFFSYPPIEISQIKEVSKTKSILSSPAPSLDRIEIKYGKFDKIIISPKDKQGFIKNLIQINPKIKNNLQESDS